MYSLMIDCDFMMWYTRFVSTRSIISVTVIQMKPLSRSQISAGDSSLCPLLRRRKMRATVLETRAQMAIRNRTGRKV